MRALHAASEALAAAAPAVGAANGGRRAHCRWCGTLKKPNVEVTGKPRVVLPEKDSLPGLVRLTAMLGHDAGRRRSK